MNANVWLDSAIKMINLDISIEWILDSQLIIESILLPHRSLNPVIAACNLLIEIRIFMWAMQQQTKAEL